MPNPILIQTRITTKQAKKLDKARKDAGMVTRSAYLRMIVDEFLKAREKQEQN